MPLSIQRNDLADVSADCIVIPANPLLVVTGGVGYAVAKRAGLRKVNRDISTLAPCEYCQAVATPAHKLRAEYLVHVVTPLWDEADVAASRQQLRRAYEAALECCVAHGAESVALPLLGAGLNEAPERESLAVARDVLEQASADLDITLVLYGSQAVCEGSALFGQVKEYIDDYYIQQQTEAAADFDWIRDFGRPDTVIEALGGQSALEIVFEDAAEDYYEAPEPAAEPMSIEFAAAPTAASTGVPAAAPTAASAGAFSAVAPMAAAPGAANESTAVKPKKWGNLGALVGTTAKREAAPECETVSIEAAAPVPSQTIEELLAHLDESFSATVLALIDQRGLTDAQVYKRANLSRQHFSKIRSNDDYRPTKRTVLALAIALELDLEQTEELLARAGFALSHASKADVIVEFFIERGIYDIFQINEMLFSFDQPLLA